MSAGWPQRPTKCFSAADVSSKTARAIYGADVDTLDRQILNRLQDGFPIVEHPFAAVAAELGVDESTLIERVRQLREDGTLTRFGPLYHAERLGGGLTLAAMEIAPDDFERVNEQVNAFPEVAHNYARDHRLNMWFVLATESPQRIDEVISDIEQVTGYRVYNMPKQQEFFVGLKFEV
ncbi:MAG: Lrp/AsnC family transcriptional regulator [Proteobacteria bacterium]|nr:MAG: Lrp/AsnC family transcriptional regulator [Pseudomonadota bacterium]QKK12646.1 MAG: Lrp/AsnC family transcriptional regulator [Pseudomonadota bacterium]